MSDLNDPRTLRRLIDESGHAFCVIEQAVGTLRQRLARLDPTDPDVLEILRAHLLAIGSPSDIMKYFSLELLAQLSAERATRTCLEAVELLARAPLNAERGYPVERAMIRRLADHKVAGALPALAVLAGREVYPISRTAARAVTAIVGSTDRDSITERLRRADLPEASAPEELSDGVSRALWPQRRTSARSSQERRRRISQERATVLPEESQTCLRPEGRAARQQRLRAILRGAGRDPSRCGNCGQPGPTRVGHVVPPPRGGTDLPGNLVAFCQGCRKRLPREQRRGFRSAPPRPPAPPAAPQLSLF